MAVIQIILWILTAYVGIGVFYNFFYAFASLLPAKEKIEEKSTLSRIAAFIPGYKEDSVIYHVAKKAAAHDYPENLFDVYVIADSFEESTLEKLRQLPVKLMEVSFEKSTKAKSLNQVMERIEEEYDIILFAAADIITGALGKELLITDTIFNSFVIITLGSFGIDGITKIFTKKGE